MNFRKLEYNEYQEVCKKVLFRTFFHSAQWEKFLEKKFSWIKFEYYIWKDDAIFSVARCRLFAKVKLISHPFCEYGGPLPLKHGVDFDKFAEDFRREFPQGSRIKFHPYVLNGARRDSPSSGSKLLTFWVEGLSKNNPEYFWDSFRADYRQRIRKAHKSGILVEVCQNRKDLKAFYDLYVGVMKAHKNIPLPFEAFEFFDIEHSAKIILAKKGTDILAGSIFLFYKPFIHYFINASDKRFRNLGANHAILWQVIQQYAGGGDYSYLDLGGTRSGARLEEFKRGSGAKEYEIYTIGETEGSARRRGLAREGWSLMPNFLIKIISPSLLRFRIL